MRLSRTSESRRGTWSAYRADGVTGGYQQDAVAEEAAANRWRMITVGFASAAVIVLAIVVVIATYVSTDPTRLVAKTLLSAALGGIATYAARQSAHDRTNARTRET